MAGDVFWLTSSQLPASSAQVPTAPAVISADIDSPEGDSTLAVVAWPSGDQEQSGVLAPESIALYQISVAQGTSFLQLGLSVDMLPVGESVQLLAFDDACNVLISSSRVTVSQSSPVALSLGGSVSVPDGVAYVAVLVGGQPSSSTDAPDMTYNLQVTTPTTDVASNVDVYYGPAVVSAFLTVSTISIVPADDNTSAPGTFVVSLEPTGSSAPHGAGIGTSGPPQGTGTGTGGPTGPLSFGSGLPTGPFSSGSGLPTGPFSTGSGLSAAGPPGASVANPSPPTNVGVGAGATTLGTLGGRDAQSAPGPGMPIDVGPLPASQYEPVAGIFSVGAPTQRVDRVEATRVEMSLVRLGSEQRSGIRAWISLDIVEDLVRDLDVTVVALTGGAPGPSRPGTRPPAAARGEVEAVGGRTVVPRPALPVPPIADDPMWGGLLATAATLPPIDQYDRRPVGAPPTNPRCHPTTDEGSPGWEGRRAEAIVLGLSGSAALGVGLYAPDLAVAVRRAVRAPAPQRRRGPATSRDNAR